MFLGLVRLDGPLCQFCVESVKITELVLELNLTHRESSRSVSTCFTDSRLPVSSYGRNLNFDSVDVRTTCEELDQFWCVLRSMQ